MPGGEIALLEAAGVLDKIDTDSREEEIGIDIVRKAVRYPYLTLLENSGITEAEAASKINTFGSSSKTPEGDSIGIDVISRMPANMLEVGIVDPVKVTRIALQNAASTATMLMSSKGIIVPVKEKQNGSTDLPR